MALTKISTGMLKQDAASSDLNIDAGTLYLDVSNNRVGIANTSPDNVLHVQESALSGRGASNGNTSLTLEHATDTGIQFFSATQTQLRFGDASDTGSGAIIYTHSDNILRLSANSAHRFTIGSTEALRIDSTGKVGIGTTAPSSPLHVTAAKNDGWLAQLINTGTGGDANGLDIHAGVDVSDYILRVREQDGTDVMAVKYGGKVGIGTTSPDNKLHVYKGASGHSWSFDGGDGFILENSDSVSINIATPSSNSGNILFSDVDARGQGRIVYDHSSDYMGFHTAGVSNERMRIDASGNLLVGKTSADGTGSTGHDIRATGLAYHTVNGGTVKVLNRTTSDGDILSFRKDGTTVGSIGVLADRIYFAGANEAVGIDDSWNAFVPLSTGGGNSDNDTDLGNPSSRFKDLYLSGTISSGRITATGGNGDQLALNNAGERFTQIGLQHSGTQNGALWLDDTDSMVDLYANTSHGIRLKTGGDNPRVTILSGGNVGIGTTDPTTDVTKFGSGAGGLSVAGGQPVVAVRATSNAQYVGYFGQVATNTYLGAIGGGDLLIQTGTSGTEKMRITSAGTAIFKGGTTNNAIQIWEGNSERARIGASSGTINFLVGDTTTSRMAIDSSGNVGIGTDSPSETLELTRLGKIGFGMNGNYGARIGYFDDGGGTHGFHIDTKHGGTTVSESRFVVRADSGNVGIGTKSPDELLSLYKTAGTTLVQAAVHANSTVGFEIKKTNSTTQTWRIVDGQTVNGVLEFYDATNSATRMAIKGNGNVGIGTAYPNTTLELGPVSALVGPTLRLSGGTGGGSGIAEYPFGTVEFFSNDPSGDGAEVKASISSLAHTGSTAPGGEIAFSTTNSGASSTLTEQVRITHDGRVGIGTDSPNRQLTVHGTVGSIADFTSTTTTGAGISLGDANTTSNYVRLRAIGNEMQLYAGNTERMRIDASGNVGIGTTTPGNKFTLYDTGGYWATIQRGNSTPGSNGPWLGLFNNINIANATFGWGIYDSNVDGSFQIWNKNNSTTGYNTFTIKRGGNVGIGTTSPNSKTHIVGAANAIALRVTNAAVDGNTADLMHIEPSNGAYYGKHLRIQSGRSDFSDSLLFLNTTAGMNGTNGSYMRVQNNLGADIFRIKGDGNVGIGTTTPSTKLHVAGATTITSADSMLLTLNPTANNYGGILYKYDGVTKGTSIYNSGMMVYGGESGTNTALQAGGQYGLFIHNSTRWVGIGMSTATPASVLNVRGDGGGSGLTFKTEDASSNETFYIQDGGRAGVRYYPFTVGIPSNTATASGVAFQVEEAGLLTVLTSGNVGIGTTTPRATLDIRGGHSSTVNEAISFGRTDDNYRYNSIHSFNTSSTNSYLSFKIHDGSSSVTQTETMRLKPGQVAINTTETYNAALRVVGATSTVNGDGDLASISTETGSLVTSGTIKHEIGYSGTYVSGKTWTWTYAATNWKAFHVSLKVASTAGFSSYEGGGYNNNGGPMSTVEHGGNLGSFVITRNGQQMIMTYTTNTTHIHPFFEITYRQSGGDGAPRMDRLSLVQT